MIVRSTYKWSPIERATSNILLQPQTALLRIWMSPYPSEPSSRDDGILMQPLTEWFVLEGTFYCYRNIGKRQMTNAGPTNIVMISLLTPPLKIQGQENGSSVQE